MPVDCIASTPREELDDLLKPFRRQFGIVVPGLQGLPPQRLASSILSTNPGFVNLVFQVGTTLVYLSVNLVDEAYRHGVLQPT